MTLFKKMREFYLLLCFSQLQPHSLPQSQQLGQILVLHKQVSSSCSSAVPQFTHLDICI